MRDTADWTSGAAVMRVDECAACGYRTTLRQKLCARCGSMSLRSTPIDGAGRLWSVTVVHRGPTREDTRDGPYAIALVDLVEGVRVMTRADIGLAIGAPVRVALRAVCGIALPYASGIPAAD